jgi:hypothetical protein
MRPLTLLMIAPVFAACMNEVEPGGSEAFDAAVEAPIAEAASPLACTGVRFDGYYMEQRGDLLYLVRFFPEGKAVLVNGTKDLRDQLPPLLVADAAGDPSMGYYNVPVEVRNDSMFFTTHPEKGTIDYSGAVVNDDRVRFLRHSNINNTDQVKEYLFHPDPSQQ